jgi:N-acetylglucosamine-6-sulfatase
MKEIHKIVVLLCCLALAACNAKQAALTEIEHPNIILILTDDLSSSDLQYMPQTLELIGAQGATFNQHIINMPLCCPSRASILRGQYAHNTHITDNEKPEGGFEKFFELGHENSTVAVWLQDAGYQTALFGKYLNGYPADAPKTYIPPGWTEWYSPNGDSHYADAAYRGYDYTVNENGTTVIYGSAPEDYATDVLGGRALGFIERNLKSGNAFFAYISTYAPHSPSTPAPRHANLFTDLPLPNSASFNEEDIKDKGRFFKQNPLLTEADIKVLEEKHRLRIQSVQAVDELVAKIYETLAQNGALDHTYIFFTSDNGFHLGQHRLLAGKNTPFEEDINVPLLIRGPGIEPGLTIDRLTSNIDFAPTFAALAGIQPPAFVDGRSLIPLLQDQSFLKWRNVVLIERGGYQFSQIPTNALVSLPVANLSGEREPIDSPYDTNVGGNFKGLRTLQYTFVEFQNGDVELYDLENDPFQLENIADTADPKLVAGFHTWLIKLSTCQADSCRDLENEK